MGPFEKLVLLGVGALVIVQVSTAVGLRAAEKDIGALGQEIG